jgi:MFS family permease
MTSSSTTTASPPAPAAKVGVRHTTAILAIILVSCFMILLDHSIIFTALPKIDAALRFSPAGLAWVQDAYTLVFGGLLLLGARASDLLGRRRVFVFGLAVFALASLLVGLAPAAWWLITARGVQGIGAAIVAPSSLSLLTSTFVEGRGRAKAVALYGPLRGSAPASAWSSAARWRTGSPGGPGFS